MPRRTDWHIFCTVVDNYGDAGVTWRLARQLAVEHGREVTLWIDDLQALGRIAAGIRSELDDQSTAGVRVRRWPADFPLVAPASVVIEAFACHLPDNYVAAMAAQAVKPVWINLEYLSAEKWIEGTHLLPSPHPTLPLTKHFFFPGFSEASGGLLRERGLFARRDAFMADAGTQAKFWESLNAPPDTGNELRISLFTYANAALPALVETWASGANPVRCLVPRGPAQAQIAEHFGARAARLVSGQLTLHLLPFIEQDHFDQMLWACDLNIVRGEDSLVRAQWAAKPFVWHIYPQAEGAHWPKLDAFLDRYTENVAPALLARIKYAWHRWNHADPDQIGAAWTAFAAARAELETHALAWCERQAARPDLATQLAEFADGLL